MGYRLNSRRNNRGLRVPPATLRASNLRNPTQMGQRSTSSRYWLTDETDYNKVQQPPGNGGFCLGAASNIAVDGLVNVCVFSRFFQAKH